MIHLMNYYLAKFLRNPPIAFHCPQKGELHYEKKHETFCKQESIPVGSQALQAFSQASVKVQG